MRTLIAIFIAATSLVAQTSAVVEQPQLAGVLEPHVAAQLLLPVHGLSSKQLAFSPVPHPALRAGADALYAPDPLLCAANYLGAEVAQLVFALPRCAIVLLDASSSLELFALPIPSLKWHLPAGVCIDAEKEQVVLLDARGPEFLWIDLADLRAGTARFQSTPLPPQWSAVRGLAYDGARNRIVGFDPAKGALLQYSPNDPTTDAGLLRPVPAVLAFCFAPTETGDHDLFVSSGDDRLLTSQWTWNASGVDVVTAALRAIVATSSWSPSSPDPSGVVYDPLLDRLVLTDGEVDEMPIYAGANAFETSRTGILSRGSATLGYTPEPTGIALDVANRTFFVSDDDKDRIYVIAAGTDGLLHTADDSIRYFSVRNFCPDAEDVAFDNTKGELWIIGGDKVLAHRLRPGSNGIFDGIAPNGDDVRMTFDLAPFGATDPEGIAVSPSDGGIYVAGMPRTLLLHLNSIGQLVRTITLPSTGLRKPAGIAFAPSTVGEGDSLFLVDRGVDNNSDPNENDGLMLEYGLPSAVLVNQPPYVDAGLDAEIVTAWSAHLSGTVEDDGLPGGSLMLQWNVLAGPGTATFTAPNQSATDASFSAPGSYTCELRVSDGEFTRTDTAVVNVEAGDRVVRAIATAHDDAEQLPDKVTRGSSSLEMVVDASVNQVVGLRFQDLAIPPGAVITSAYLQFTAKDPTSVPTELVIAGQASDNAATFLTTVNSISSRPRTAATVAWSPAPWNLANEAGINQRTPDLTSIVHEVTSRPGWVSGNAIVFVITGTGCRTASAYDNSPAVAPRLVVNFQ